MGNSQKSVMSEAMKKLSLRAIRADKAAHPAKYYPEVAKNPLKEFKVTAIYTQKVDYYIMASNHEEAKSLFDNGEGVEFKGVKADTFTDVYDMTVKVVARLDKD